MTLSNFAYVCSNAFGLSIIVLAAALISCVIVCHVHICLPILFPRSQYPIAHLVSLATVSWISFNVVFQYVCALSVDPNQMPPETWAEVVEQHPDPETLRKCMQCNHMRLPRARHCYMCGRCVQKLDHHCPWINNCVGHENQRYFFLFLLYLLMGTAFCGAQITHLKGLMGLSIGWELPFFLSLDTRRSVLFSLFHRGGQEADSVRVTYSQAQVAAMDGTAVLFTQILCAVIFISMVGFVSWSLYLMLTNQTAMEYPSNAADRSRWTRGSSWNPRLSSIGIPYRHPYDLGRLHNALQVFATQGDRYTTSALKRSPRGLHKALVLLWATLPSIEPLVFDGSWWPRWDGENHHSGREGDSGRGFDTLV